MLARLRTRLRAGQPDSPAGGRVWPFIAALLRTVAEAGWLSVLYAAASVLADKRSPVIGPIEMVAFVGAGVVLGIVGRRRPSLGALLLIGGVVVGGAIGSLAGSSAEPGRADLLSALGAHFAGWLAGIAVLRGAIVSIGERAAEQLEQMLRGVPLVLGILWAYTTFAARDELWLPFAVAAMWGTAMYLGGTLVGIGMARLNILHAEVTDVQQRRAWRWLVLGVGMGAIPLMVPLAVLAGIPLTAMLGPIIGPIQWLIGLLAYPLAFIIWIFSILLSPIAGPLSQALDDFANRVFLVPEQEGPYEVANALALVITAATMILIVLIIFLAARWLLSRRSTVFEDPEGMTFDVQHEIVVPEYEKPPKPPRIRRRRAPHDAIEAYLSAIAALETHGELARQPAETPGSHAARLRPIESARGVDLARLAAAYQLARYGERVITRRENSRALDRFNRIRRALRLL